MKNKDEKRESHDEDVESIKNVVSDTIRFIKRGLSDEGGNEGDIKETKTERNAS